MKHFYTDFSNQKSEPKDFENSGLCVPAGSINNLNIYLLAYSPINVNPDREPISIGGEFSLHVSRLNRNMVSNSEFEIF